MSRFFKGLSRFSSSFLSGVVIGLPIYITVNDYVFCIARVEGTSMQPTLNPKLQKQSDVVILDRWNTNYDSIKRGDIVALTSPSNQNVSFIKRVIGLEGDVVETPRYRHSYVYIPRGHCWVEGDNSRSSLDSNSFGPVSLGLVKGRATHIVWPPKRWQSLEHILPEDRKPTSLENLNKRINNHFNNNSVTDKGNSGNFGKLEDDESQNIIGNTFFTDSEFQILNLEVEADDNGKS